MKTYHLILIERDYIWKEPGIEPRSIGSTTNCSNHQTMDHLTPQLRFCSNSLFSNYEVFSFQRILFIFMRTAWSKKCFRVVVQLYGAIMADLIDLISQSKAPLWRIIEARNVPAFDKKCTKGFEILKHNHLGYSCPVQDLSNRSVSKNNEVINFLSQ